MRYFACENDEILDTQTVQKCILSGGRTHYECYSVITFHVNAVLRSFARENYEILNFEYQVKFILKPFRNFYLVGVGHNINVI